jgi:5'-nucleotidase
VRALVTNDDGIGSQGLLTLARVAFEAGLDVVVAAPHREASGSSAALTAVEEHGWFLVHRRTLDGLEDVPAFAVEGSPAFIALTALRGAFGPAPDVVLSGVNHGPNTGHAVLHSGTVGAALTASTYGCRALAVSMAAAGPTQWGTAAVVARRAVDWLVVQDEPSVLNVNVPDIPVERLRGLRPARLAAFGAVQTNVVEVDEGSVKLEFAEVEEDHEPGTDTALLAEGWATLTELVAPCERPADFPGLQDEPGASD